MTRHYPNPRNMRKDAIISRRHRVQARELTLSSARPAVAAPAGPDGDRGGGTGGDWRNAQRPLIVMTGLAPVIHAAKLL
jgi:hypothetical protein